MIDPPDERTGWLVRSFGTSGRSYADVPRCIQSRSRVGVPDERRMEIERGRDGGVYGDESDE